MLASQNIIEISSSLSCSTWDTTRMAHDKCKCHRWNLRLYKIHIGQHTYDGITKTFKVMISPFVAMDFGSIALL